MWGDALEREEGNDIRKYNTLDILNNVGSIFTDLLFSLQRYA